MATTSEIEELRALCRAQLQSEPIEISHPWVARHREHLAAHLPKLCEVLRTAGLLEIVSRSAASRATARYAEMVEAGQSPEVAKEIVLTEILLPVSEAEIERQRAEMKELREDAEQDSAAILVRSLKA